MRTRDGVQGDQELGQEREGPERRVKRGEEKHEGSKRTGGEGPGGMEGSVEGDQRVRDEGPLTYVLLTCPGEVSLLSSANEIGEGHLQSTIFI